MSLGLESVTNAFLMCFPVILHAAVAALSESGGLVMLWSCRRRTKKLMHALPCYPANMKFSWRVSDGAKCRDQVSFSKSLACLESWMRRDATPNRPREITPSCCRGTYARGDLDRSTLLQLSTESGIREKIVPNEHLEAQLCHYFGRAVICRVDC